MKRLLSILLLAALCLTFALPLAAAQEPAAKEIRAASESILSNRPTVPAKRNSDRPYLEPSPLMTDLTIKAGDISYLAFIGRNPKGYSSSIFGIEIYRGTTVAESTYIGSYVDYFSTGSTSEEYVGLDTTELGMGAGTYTVCYFNLQISGDELYIIEGTEKRFSMKVVNYDIPLQGLSFYGLENQLNVRVGDSATYISPRLTPTNTTVNRMDLMYSVSDSSIFDAYSYAGLFGVFGRKAGDAILHLELGGVSFDMNVHVKPPHVESVAFNLSELRLHAGQQSETPLTVSVQPDADYPVTVYSENPEVAAVKQEGPEFIVEAGVGGSTRIVADCSGKKAYCTVYVEAHYGEVIESAEPTATQPGYELVRCEHEACLGTEQKNYYDPIFEDTDSDAWYCEGVDFVYENGIFTGVGPAQFAPNNTMTRGMVVTVLWRVAGEPSYTKESGFVDLAHDWYVNPIGWAAENGVVTGVAPDRFAPDKDVTREQLATILYRYAKLAGEDMELTADLSVFPDADQVSEWADEAMQWCVAKGLISGSDGKLLPQGNATRAQVATIIMRYLANAAPTPAE